MYLIMHCIILNYVAVMHVVVDYTVTTDLRTLEVKLLGTFLPDYHFRQHRVVLCYYSAVAELFTFVK